MKILHVLIDYHPVLDKRREILTSRVGVGVLNRGDRVNVRKLGHFLKARRFSRTGRFYIFSTF